MIGRGDARRLGGRRREIRPAGSFVCIDREGKEGYVNQAPGERPQRVSRGRLVADRPAKGGGAERAVAAGVVPSGVRK